MFKSKIKMRVMLVVLIRVFINWCKLQLQGAHTKEKVNKLNKRLKNKKENKNR